MIENSKITLIPCDLYLTELIVNSNDVELAEVLKINIAPNWSPFEKELFQYALQKLNEDKNNEGWLAYLPIQENTKTLIGSCGFKGKPDKNGNVEIGYEVAKQFRNLGYATEMVSKLIDLAFSFKQIKIIEANTLAKESASTRILEKTGFKFNKVHKIENEVVWNWKIEKITQSKNSIRLPIKNR